MTALALRSLLCALAGGLLALAHLALLRAEVRLLPRPVVLAARGAAHAGRTGGRGTALPSAALRLARLALVPAALAAAALAGPVALAACLAGFTSGELLALRATVRGGRP